MKPNGMGIPRCERSKPLKYDLLAIAHDGMNGFMLLIMLVFGAWEKVSTVFYECFMLASVKENMTTLTRKRCPRCLRVLRITEFHRSRSSTTGRCSECKVCANLRVRAYYYAHRLKCIETQRRYQAKKRAKLLLN